jgi:hypothetical protein
MVETNSKTGHPESTRNKKITQFSSQYLYDQPMKTIQQEVFQKIARGENCRTLKSENAMLNGFDSDDHVSGSGLRSRGEHNAVAFASSEATAGANECEYSCWGEIQILFSSSCPLCA